MNTNVYLDHAATTPLDEEVHKIMQPYFSDAFGNPSSIHSRGHEAAGAVAKARRGVAEVLGSGEDEIIFTSSGTESNNMALLGIAEVNKFCGHIITSAIEHHSVLATAQYLESRGVSVTYIGVGRDGIIDPKHVGAAIRDDTFLISIMSANNEIGTLQPIKQIRALARTRAILFHTDAVQLPGIEPLSAARADLLSLSAHKFYGPKGIGVLYVRRGVEISPQLHGGSQESGRRASTLNVPAIIGCAYALKKAEEQRERSVKQMRIVRDWMLETLPQKVPGIIITGAARARLSNSISFCIPHIEGDSLVMRLSERGFDCSSVSACGAGDNAISHVLLALGLPREVAMGSIRVSIGRDTTKKELEDFVSTLAQEVKKFPHLNQLQTR